MISLELIINSVGLVKSGRQNSHKSDVVFENSAIKTQSSRVYRFSTGLNCVRSGWACIIDFLSMVEPLVVRGLSSTLIMVS